MKQLLSLLTLSLSILLLGNPAAHAANVDYSGLETLFGEPVTTSATGKPQRISETTLSMDVITADEIARSGALDIPQLLRRKAGIDVVRNYKGHADVNIRGFNQPFSNRLLVLVNGRQVYLDNFGMTLWHTLPVQMHDIKQIEIVRGPNTSLFGFNAASGVINIITFNPAFDDQSYAEVRGGTQHHRELSLGHTLELDDKLHTRISLGGLRSDGYSRSSFGGRTDADDALERNNGMLDMLWQTSKRTSVRLELGINDQETDVNFPYHIGTMTDSTMRHAMLDVIHDTKSAGLWNIRAYRNDLNFKTLDGQDNTLHVLQLSHLTSPAPAHTLRWGAEYRDNSVKGLSVGAGVGRFSMDILSANAMWDWQINDRLSTTHSIRGDFWSTERFGGISSDDKIFAIPLSGYEQDDAEFSFNSGILYKTSPTSSIRLSAGRGLHIPSLAELALDISSIPGGEFYGNPQLNTESTTMVELGYEHKLPKQNLTLGSSLYYQRIDNVIAPTLYLPAALGGPAGAEADFTFENIGDARAYGIELTASGTLLSNALSWETNYSYQLTRNAPHAAYQGLMNFAGTQPKHKINLNLSYTRGPWELDTNMHYVSGTGAVVTVADIANPQRAYRVDDYFILNTRIGYHFNTQTSLSLDGFNLLDNHHERPSYLYSLGAGSTYGGGVEVGKTVLLTLRHRF